MSVEKKVPEIRFKGFREDWNQRKLDTIFGKIRNAFVGTATPYYVKEGHFYLESNNVKDGKINRKNEIFINDEFYYKQSDKWLREDDIVMVQSGHVGHTAVIPPELNNIAAHALIMFTDPKEEISSHFLNFQFQTDKVKAKLSEITTGNTIKHILSSEMKEFEIFFSDYEEQTQIGNYFQKLDSLINQHQQKHDKLSSIKKTMLEKMFPKQGDTIPEIRFKGFSGGWRVEPFGVCFANIPNNTLSRSNLNYENGMAKNIHYGDVLIKFGEILDATNELLPFITNDDIANKLKHAALRDGDIIIADAAEDSMVGKCAELFNVDGQLILSGLHTIAVRTTFSFASKYLGYYLNSSSYHDQLLSLMQGTKVLSISKTAIQNTNIAFPKSAEEQTQIGNYFQKLDSLINQHQQQITKLNNIKQACLSKMFI
ncbi:restriction endonuclease subunit S [Yersinia aleksiciae]|uniref:restriction endonuclease subunit S n=1 Tax=Yersinia aleksiciae TaxID=263819 RepID=UPI0011A8A55E|nr:restriction endonuclease subunit S [Yersinia aleksiciae]